MGEQAVKPRCELPAVLRLNDPAQVCGGVLRPNGLGCLTAQISDDGCICLYAEPPAFLSGRMFIKQPLQSGSRISPSRKGLPATAALGGVLSFQYKPDKELRLYSQNGTGKEIQELF